MSAHDFYRLHSRLIQLMSDFPMTVEELHVRTKVGRDAITSIRQNSAQRVTLNHIANICGELGITLNDLFELLVQDIWMPVRLGRELKIHVGSNKFTEPRPVSKNGEAVMVGRESVGSWDFRAINHLWDYIRKTHPGVVVQLMEHVSRPAGTFDAGVRAAAEEIFKSGNHLILGSPISNQLCEEVICRAFKVPSCDPASRIKFPYGHVWDSWKRVLSSFGWQAHGKQVGIAALPSNNLVAPCKMVESGLCTDGALIVVIRLYNRPSKRESADASDRIIICISGHSGLGTLAAAHVATDPNCAPGLFPAERDVPRMRAVACTYNRPPGDAPFDPRDLTSKTLLPDGEDPPPEQHADAGKKRRTPPTSRGRRRATAPTSTVLSGLRRRQS